MTALFHGVMVNGYVAAMRPAVLVAVGALALASASCLLVVGRRQVPASEPAVATIEEEAA